MRTGQWVILGCWLTLFACLFGHLIQAENLKPTAVAPSIAVHFSPDGGCATAITAELAQAEKTLNIGIYNLTFQPLADSIAAASKRGIVVRIIVDQSMRANEYGSLFAGLQKAKCQVRVDGHEKIFHNKYAIIDGKTVITGSYNWTDNAEKENAENSIVIHDAGLAKQYTADFEKHWAHSTPYVVRP